MAQRFLRGQSGLVTMPSGQGAQIAAWDAVLVQEVHDVTGFGNSAGWRRNLGGLKSMSGSASGFLTAGTANDSPNFTGESFTGSSVTFTADTGCTYTGNFIFSNIRLGVRVDLPGTITFDFVSDGTITEAWSSDGSAD